MSGSTLSWPPTGSRFAWPAVACRCLLAAVLLMAGASKVVRLAEFVDRLTLLGIPCPVARIAGSFVPWLELTLGGCLFLGVMRREAAALSAGLLVVFSAFLFVGVSAEECDCFVIPGCRDWRAAGAAGCWRGTGCCSCWPWSSPGVRKRRDPGWIPGPRRGVPRSPEFRTQTDGAERATATSRAESKTTRR